MPLPQAVARFNRRYTNRFIEPLVARLPGFVIVEHAGRKTGTTYRTPLYAFDSDDTLFIALTYGPSADWAQHVPLLARVGLQALRVADFMQITLR